MPFRDPRVLSESLDNNITNAPAAAPEAATVQPNDTQGADNTWTGGAANTNAYNLIPAPPEEQAAYNANAPLVEYPGGTPDTNVTKGPNDRDSALDTIGKVNNGR